MSYNEKYLKYKNKYLALKDLVGGFTYDLKDPKQKEKATNALLSAGIAQSKIDELYDAIKKYKSVKRNDAELPYNERFHVKLIQGHLKFFYEDELKNLNPIPVVMSQNEKRDSGLADTVDNLPEHLPASELSPKPLPPLPLSPQPTPPPLPLSPQPTPSPQAQSSPQVRSLEANLGSTELNVPAALGLFGAQQSVSPSKYNQIKKKSPLK